MIWSVYCSISCEKKVELLFYDRAYDHQMFFEWGTVYLIDMKRLLTTHPDLHDAFMNVFLTVSCNKSPNKFNLVSMAMALEQSMNRDSKTKGGSYKI